MVVCLTKLVMHSLFVFDCQCIFFWWIFKRENKYISKAIRSLITYSFVRRIKTRDNSASSIVSIRLQNSLKQAIACSFSASLYFKLFMRISTILAFSRSLSLFFLAIYSYNHNVDLSTHHHNIILLTHRHRNNVSSIVVYSLSPSSNEYRKK